MRSITAIFKTNTGKEQKVDITHADMGWIAARASQIEAVEYKDVEPRNHCKRCGEPTDGQPQWMTLCDSCFGDQGTYQHYE